MPLDPTGGSAPDPRYRLVLPRSQILRARTTTVCLSMYRHRDVTDRRTHGRTARHNYEHYYNLGLRRANTYSLTCRV